MPDTGSIHFTIIDGRRKPLSTTTQVLVRLLNGAQQIDPKWATGGDITVSGIPFTDTGNDAYNVFAHVSGYNDAVTPDRVRLLRNGTVEVALLAVPNNGRFHFPPWEQFKQVDSRIVRLVMNGALADPAGRYSESVEASPMKVGALLNLATAIRDIPLDDGTSPQATGWQAHSVRGFVSGTLGKKMGRTVESTKREDGERLYQAKG
jgi:Protein of unknown function (DUF3489)